MSAINWSCCFKKKDIKIAKPKKKYYCTVSEGGRERKDKTITITILGNCLLNNLISQPHREVYDI